MTKPSRYADLRAAFDALLSGLEPVWPAASLSYVREEVARDEYGEALENLAALALREGHALDAAALRRIETLAARTGLEGSPHLAALRQRMG